MARSWRRIGGLGGHRGTIAMARAGSVRRPAAYSRYALLIALAIWLLEQLPAGTDSMAARDASPALMLLWCTLCVFGSAFAAGLSILGAGRPSRRNLLLSAVALAICCLPVP